MSKTIKTLALVTGTITLTAAAMIGIGMLLSNKCHACKTYELEGQEDDEASHDNEQKVNETAK